jgi:ADP-ribosylglycohydrolase
MVNKAKKIDRDRARGCLLGLAIGDALGATLEFEEPPKYRFSTLLRGPHVDITGGGPHQLAPFETTDDTAMAARLAASLMKHPLFDAADVAARYAEWAVDAPDVGTQTAEVLHRVRTGVPVAQAAADLWHEEGGRPAGNGALMRTAPIGVAFALRPMKELVRAAANDAAITHWDPRCQLASVAFDAAIAAALTGNTPPDPHDLRQAAFDSFPFALTHADMRSHDPAAYTAACDEISSDLMAATAKDPGLYAPKLHLHRHQGFVRVAFRLAFWELFHAPTFEAALIDVVNRGGDADTNGAITGALLGSFYGESAIPSRWAGPMLRAHTSKTKRALTDVGALLALADRCAERGRP